MPTFATIPAKPWHCGQMCRLLRHEHRNTIAQLGIDCHAELRARFEASSFRKAWLIDGRLAALGGIMGAPLASSGFVWLALSEQARRYPIAIVKEARRQLDAVMVVKRELATTVLNGDEAAKRLAIFLGFHVSHDGPGQQAFSRFGRRSLARHLDSDPDLRIPIGEGFAVALGYHHEAA